MSTEVHVKSVWKSRTLWFNWLVAIGTTALETMQFMEGVSRFDDPSMWAALLSAIGNTILRLWFTNQAITEKAALKPTVATVKMWKTLP